MEFGVSDERAARLIGLLLPHKLADEAVSLYREHETSKETRARLAEWDEKPGDEALEKIRRELLPGVLAVECLFTEIPRQWPFVFYRTHSDAEVGTWGERGELCLAQIRPPGSPTVLDLSERRNVAVYNIEIHDIALGTQITKQDIEAVRHQESFCNAALGLAESFVQTEEILHACVFNTGRSFDSRVGGDGLSLFSEAHPVPGGTYSNMFGNGYDLNQAALEEAAIRIKKMQLANGLPSRARPVTLVVPIELSFAAERLFMGLVEDFEKLPSGYPQSYQVLDYLRDPKAWFLTTTIRGLVSVGRRPFRLDLTIDNGRLLLTGAQSYGTGHINPRGCFASFPEN